MDGLLSGKRLLNRLASFNYDRQLRENMVGIYTAIRRHVRMIVDCFLSGKPQMKSSLYDKFKVEKVS